MSIHLHPLANGNADFVDYTPDMTNQGLYHWGTVTIHADHIETNYLEVFCDDNGVVYWDDIYIHDSEAFDDILLPGHDGYGRDQLTVGTPDEFAEYMDRYDWVSDSEVRRDIELMLAKVGA